MSNKPKFKEKTINLFSPQIEINEPFTTHVDPSRTNMSSKQLLQTVLSEKCDYPFVIGKHYKEFVSLDTPFILKAKESGRILHNTNNLLIIYYEESKKIMFEHIPPIKHLTNNALTLRFKKEIGVFKKGDLLFDYTGVVDNVPSIGYRTNVMFSSWLGYCAEDAFACSESWAERARIDYSTKLYIPISKTLRFLKNKVNGKHFYDIGEKVSGVYMKYMKVNKNSAKLEETILDISLSELYTNNISGDGYVRDIKLHKITNKSYAELFEEYELNQELIKELNDLEQRIYKDVYSPIHETIKKTYAKDHKKWTASIYNQFFGTSKPPRKMFDKVEEYGVQKQEVDFILEVDLHHCVPTMEGDKFANLFAGKGVVSLIIPDNLMPKDPDGKPVDVIFNPLGIYGRNNWGSMFELKFSMIIRCIENEKDKDIFIKKIEFMVENYIKRIDDEYYYKASKILTLLKTNEDFYTHYRNKIKEKGFYFVSMNYNGISYADSWDNIFTKFAEIFDKSLFDKSRKRPYTISKDLVEFMYDHYGMTTCVEPEEIQTESFFGEMYYLKLFHTAYSKYNSTSVSNSFNANNGQPPRGRKKNGGCHVSWQTFSSGFGHNEKGNIIGEVWTLKSDCQSAKLSMITSIVFEGEYHLQDKYQSMTMENINHYLSLYGMSLREAKPLIKNKETEALRIQKIQQIKENVSHITGIDLSKDDMEMLEDVQDDETLELPVGDDFEL